jgi:multisubunit Na+/H+ antiporter MnhG subunit
MKIHKHFAAVALAGALIALPAAAQGHSSKVTRSGGVLTNPAGSHTLGRATTRTNTEGNKTMTTMKMSRARTTHTITHTKTMRHSRH